MIIVTGASGQLGRAIVEKLIEHVPAEQIGASVRDPEKARELEARGIRVRRGDFADPATLSNAFGGATQVLIVSSNASAYGGDPLVQHQAAINAAKAAGANRIVYTSHMAASRASQFPPMRDHAATEEMLDQSGLAWTSLRNGFYASSGLLFLGDAPKTGVLEVPEDGKVSWTAHADLAEAAAILLADEGRYEGPTPPLTGSQALDLADLAGIVSSLQSQPVGRQIVPDEDFQAKMAARGLPGHVVGIMLGFYRASRKGEFAAVDPTLEGLLGRCPILMQDVIAQKISSKSASY